jgi:hypothetical protein
MILQDKTPSSIRKRKSPPPPQKQANSLEYVNHFVSQATFVPSGPMGRSHL